MKNPLRGYEEMPVGIMNNSLCEYEEGSCGAYVKHILHFYTCNLCASVLVSPSLWNLIHLT